MINDRLELKSITADDLGAVVELDQACFSGLWTLDAYKRELDSPNSVLLGLFAPLSKVKLLAMGCFWSILEEAHITILAVHPQYQRQGLGQAILYFLLKTAYELGLERATLEVRVSNKAAISLYQKFGFKTAGQRRRYYKNNDEDALILWLGNIQYPEFQDTLEKLRIKMSDRLNLYNWSIVDC
ncbi:ribosomal-protein-alanine N-acetyltransferase [Fischerella thermalis CCMEE 5268]|uniref:Ribosomal-protein-alanine N-acetyltransferase n=1 Tax=Fischerella thermalis CCMEE 5268 TaxID=2019662 RepID=A0A2N6KI39_9CYAN|nr:ribosomal protein S18-alanine N-acetyltransferase [Fischerella thermalis]PLZ99122.1 ribosomal-protein-alanine N-acetyltransferase [Fischerella thermalis CCMEE 5268]